MSTARDPVILSAVRTPIGRFRGALADVTAADLGATVIRAAVERAGISTPAAVDEVLMGNVVSAGLGQNVARQAAIRGGLPSSVGATTVNKVCGASLKVVTMAAQAIRCGDADVFVCGGLESMSRAPFLVDGRLDQLRYGSAELRDALVVDGLWCAFEDWAMGSAAECIADKYGLTREAMDQYALGSHRKAVAAMDAGKFRSELVPVVAPRRGGADDRRAEALAQDEAPRRDTSIDALRKLRPAFRPDGRITAGNAAGLNDAAAALVVASRASARVLGACPLARVAGYAQVALEPRDIFDAPAAAILKLLGRTGWRLGEVDLLEVNEAFAAQILANGCALERSGWTWERVNVHGGAIALGHPLGATGARLLTTLAHALVDRGGQRGIACLCLGGGEAIAVAIERDE